MSPPCDGVAPCSRVRTISTRRFCARPAGVRVAWRRGAARRSRRATRACRRRRRRPGAARRRPRGRRTAASWTGTARWRSAGRPCGPRPRPGARPRAAMMPPILSSVGSAAALIAALPESKKSLSVSRRTFRPRRDTVVETFAPEARPRFTSLSIRRLSAWKSCSSWAALLRLGGVVGPRSGGHRRPARACDGRERRQRRLGRGRARSSERVAGLLHRLAAAEHGAGERLLQRLLERLDLATRSSRRSRRARRTRRTAASSCRSPRRASARGSRAPRGGASYAAAPRSWLTSRSLLLRRRRPRPAPPRSGARPAGRRPSASPRRRAGCRPPGWPRMPSSVISRKCISSSESSLSRLAIGQEDDVRRADADQRGEERRRDQRAERRTGCSGCSSR